MTDSIINLINHTKPEAFVALVLIFGGGLVVAIIAVIGGIICHFRKHEAELNLKHEMIARGMSAEEIKTVLEARSEK
jgi:hypothetical protein